MLRSVTLGLLLAFLLGLAGACGGADAGESCVQICEAQQKCPNVFDNLASASCEDVCASLVRIVEKAQCSEGLQSLLDCAEPLDACADDKLFEFAQEGGCPGYDAVDACLASACKGDDPDCSVVDHVSKF